MKLTNLLGSLAIAASLGGVGCMVSGDAAVYTPDVVVTTAPPEPVYEVEVTQPRPGMVWIGGHYDYVGGRYVWRRGYYEHARPGRVWVPARWENRNGRYVRVEGRWR